MKLLFIFLFPFVLVGQNKSICYGSGYGTTALAYTHAVAHEIECSDMCKGGFYTVHSCEQIEKNKLIDSLIVKNERLEAEIKQLKNKKP